MSLPITVIVPVKNETLNIEPCLRSVGWADQVFVVDSQSTDDTVQRAEKLGATVVQFRYDGDWPKKKNWAIRNLPTRNDWILILDADERVTPDLRNEIAAAVQREDIQGYYIRWKFIFLGRWLKHCWSHGWMLRLFRKGAGEYEDLGMRGEGGWDNEVHENIIVDGETGSLESYLLHESYQSVAHWLEKHNQFSGWLVKRYLQIRQERGPIWRNIFTRDHLRRRRAMRAVFVRLPFRPVFMFVYFYIVQRGFLDGRAGFYYCMLLAFHELTISIKAHELRLKEWQRSL